MGIRFSTKRKDVLCVEEVECAGIVKDFPTVEPAERRTNPETSRKEDGKQGLGRSTPLRLEKRPSLYPRLDGVRSKSASFKDWHMNYSGFSGQEERDSSGDEQWADALEGFAEAKPSAPVAASTAKPVTADAPGTVHGTSSGEAAQLLADPPTTRLDFNISEEAFRAAQRADAGSPESYWTYAMYRGPVEDGIEKRVKVHYCKSHHTMERVCQYFLEEKILGFDLEWMVWSTKNDGPRANVSLIQLASPSRVGLFHTAMFPENDKLASPSFRKIMENQEISKVGVAIKADCTRLEKHLGVKTRGIFELSNLYKLVKYSKTGQLGFVNKRLVPLAAQVREHLGLPMFKGNDVRSSDWTRPLSMDQIICEGARISPLNIFGAS
jgi:exonuclease 3'-5' domain-containing protein 2